MRKEADSNRNKFKTRASLTQPKNHSLSYNERLKIANGGKKTNAIDLSAPINSAGFMVIR
jgi:hypothetical protein